MSRKMGDLKKAGAKMDQLFTEASESHEEIKDTDIKTTEEKGSEGKIKAKKTRKTDTQKVFSFRADKDTVDSWRVWADAKGMKVDELGEKALSEYIKRHSLTEDQRQIYELKMAQKKS